MISLDFSVLYQVVIFLVLWLVLNKLFFHPYARVLEERERKTSGAARETGDLEREGQRLKSEYEEKIARVKMNADTAKESIVQEARRERERVLADARQRASRELQRVRGEVQAQLQLERERATAEIPAVARDMVSKAIGRSLT